MLRIISNSLFIIAIAFLLVVGCTSDTGTTPDPEPTHEVPFSIGITDNSGGSHNGASLLFLTFGGTTANGTFGANDSTRVNSALVTTGPTIDGAVDSVWSEATATTIVCTPQSGDNGISSATMKSLYTTTDVYFLVQWVDPTGTKNIHRKQWMYDGADWAQNSENEDRVFFMWDIDGASDSTGTFAEKGCDIACHGEMQPESGKLDVWHWKATRTDAAEYADDQVADDTGRGNDDGSGGYSDNVDVDTPNYQDPSDPGANADFLWTSFPGHTDAVDFDGSAAWSNGDMVAGYVHKVPAGSRGDVSAKGSYNDATNTWTVEFKRALNTGDANDDAIIIIE